MTFAIDKVLLSFYFIKLLAFLTKLFRFSMIFLLANQAFSLGEELIVMFI